MNNNSLEAWFDQATQKNVHSLKLHIMKTLKKYPNISSRQISAILGKENEVVKKRLTDLKNEGLIIQSGDRVEGKHKNSIFCINENYTPLIDSLIQGKPLMKQVDFIIREEKESVINHIDSLIKKYAYSEDIVHDLWSIKSLL